MRRRAIVAALGLAVVAGCGPSRAAPTAPVELEAFVDEFGPAFCHRLYRCCTQPDLGLLSPGEDEDACAAHMTENARVNAELLLGFRGIVYDPLEAAHCLESLHDAACPSIFGPLVGELIACQTIFPGTLPEGAICDDPHECATARCETGRCAATPPAVFSAAEFLNERKNICVPTFALGASCGESEQCGVGASCVQTKCAKLLHDGEPCSTIHQCEGTCAAPPDGSGPSVCRPGYCRGR